MAEPLMLPRQHDYPMPGHLQRAQTTPANRVDDLFFAAPNDAKRATSPVPQRLPTVGHSATSSYSTPSSITPSSTPPLVVNGVPLTSGAVLNKQPPRSTPASLAPTTSSTTSTVSLYQTSIALRDRLQGVPGFQHFLELTEKPNSTDPAAPSEHDTLDLDVVSHLWRCFMLGPSLCCIYNALNPAKKLEINRDCTLADLKDCKKAVYHFLVAIKDIVPSSKLFTISDLYNNNTNGIVKVVTTVTALLDILEERGLLLPVESQLSSELLDNPVGSRQKVIRELITTEREYVASLEQLMDFRNELQAKNLLNSDTIHLLFANLPQLVEFQRRFLIGVEVLVTLPEEKQQFGSLFTRMEEGFEVYEPFCANFAYANELALEETKNGTLSQLSNLVDPQHQFGSLLIKPVQRICKYPLLLKQLLRYTDKEQNPHLYSELEAGIASIERVTNRVNETKREQENISIQKELETRIVNWKEIDRVKLGNLLLTETFPVLMGDKERTFQCFLFQKMLMCCRDDALSAKDKKSSKTMSMSKKGKAGKGRDSSVPAKSPLHVKGRLYIRDVRDVYIPQDRSTGTYFITIRYRPDDNPELPIILRPRNEETMLKWYNTLTDLHQKCMEAEGDHRESNNSLLADPQSFHRQTFGYAKERTMSFLNGNSRGNYASKFNGQIDVPNPITPPGSGSDDGQEDLLRSLPMSRNGSSNTSDRGQFELQPHQIARRAAPNRFPHNPHGLPPHARTGSLGVTSDFQGSYFSPMVDTPPLPSSRPMSPHSSQQFPFPSQRNDETQMGRTLSREGYGNGIPTPPLTAKSMQGLGDRQSRPMIAPLISSRSRSASTPNIHQIQTNLQRGKDIPPPLPAGRRDLESDSPVTPRSPISPVSSRPTTGTSTFTAAFSSIPETPSSASSASTSATRRGVPSTPGSTNSFDKTSALKVKITYGNDMFVVVVPSDVTYAALVQKVRHKLSVCSNVARDGPLRMKYQDEDGDLVTISSDEDVAMAVESRSQHNNTANAGFAGAGVINLLVYSSAI